MSVATVMAAGRGALEFCLTVEGIPTVFSTNVTGAWTGLPTGVTSARGTLRRDGLRVGQSVSIASAELSAPGISFRLVDGVSSSGAAFLVSSLMTGLSAATTTRLTATLSTGVGPALVESAASFAASGDIYCELETIGYPSKGAAQFDANLVRGKYGSKEVVHTYDAADAGETRADFGLVPEVTDRPVSWYGRRCTLWAAEWDGTVLTTAETIWKGRIAGDIECDGAEWVIPAESIWDALATEILAGQPTTVVKGILLEAAVTVDFAMVVIDGGASIESTFSVDAGTYLNAGALYAHVTERLNAAIVALAGPTERYEIIAEHGKMLARQTAPAGAATYETSLYFPTDMGVTTDGQVLAAALNAVMELDLRGFPGQFPMHIGLALPQYAYADGRFLDRFGPAPSAVVAVATGGMTTLPVERVGDIAQWFDEGDFYATRSIVTMDGQPYGLDSVNAAGGTITIYPMTDEHLQQVAPSLVVQAEADTPIVIKLGVWLRGTLPLMWRDGFIDHASVLLSLKAGIDSADIDWTDLAEQVPGGQMAERDRLLTSPQSFRDIFAEDLAWCGLVPIMLPSGKVSARPLASQGLVRDDGAALPAISSDTLQAGDAALMQWGVKRVVNRLEMTAVREYGRPLGRVGLPTMEIHVTLNDRQSQGRYRLINSSPLECSGVGNVTEADIAAHAYGLASSLFSLTGRDYPIAKVGCLGALYSVLPMDCVDLSHWLLPAAAGGRGLANALAICTGVTTDWIAHRVELDLLVLTDGARRSGFAPAARVTSYVDNGAGAGDARYELTLETGHYSSIAEGLFFLAGMKCELRQWDDDSAPSSQSVTISPDAHNAGGTSVYLTASLILPDGSTLLLTLDEYDTASQTAPAKRYLHVADDADNLLGTSGELGFVMG